MKTIFTAALALFAFATTQATTAQADVSAKSLVETKISSQASGKLGVPSDHSTPEAIARDYKDFVEVYKDFGTLYTADDFRTPAAKKYLDKLKLQTADAVMTKVSLFKKKLDQLQKRMRNMLLLTAVRVSDKQMPRIYKLAKTAAERLELRGKFNIFILNSPSFNAFTYSYDTKDFDVVLNSGLVENLTDEAILAIIGHEMGHVKDQAILNGLVLAADFESQNKQLSSADKDSFYNELFNELPKDARDELALGALDIVAQGATLAAIKTRAEAAEFSRNGELTADRAAVIVCGSEKAPLAALAALAYGSKALTSEFSVDELIKQITDVLANSTEEGDVEFLVTQGQDTHPFNVLRLIQARDFARSKSFTAINDKLAQTPFNKELDLFVTAMAKAVSVAAKLQKYEKEQAELDDTLVRLKTEKTLIEEFNSAASAVKTLAELMLLQMEGSNLGLKDNALFDAFVAKAKADKAELLKNVFMPALKEVIERVLKSAKGEEADELKAKLKVLEGLKALDAAKQPA